MSRLILLHEFAAALAADDSPYRFSHIHDEMVRNVVLSKAVPVVGIGEGQYEQQRIDHWITLETDVDVWLDCVSVVVSRDPPPPNFISAIVQRQSFRDVQIDKDAALTWLREILDDATASPQAKRGRKSKRAEFEALCAAGASPVARDMPAKLERSKRTLRRYRQKMRP